MKICLNRKVLLQSEQLDFSLALLTDTEQAKRFRQDGWFFHRDVYLWLPKPKPNLVQVRENLTGYNVISVCLFPYCKGMKDYHFPGKRIRNPDYVIDISSFRIHPDLRNVEQPQEARIKMGVNQLETAGIDCLVSSSYACLPGKLLASICYCSPRIKRRLGLA